ncbi:MAG: hypothetical protein RL338_1029 [Chloroflexota bacterium]|jgi:PPOX class probable F420-dependent enzyme
MSLPLPHQVRTFLDRGSHATIATVGPDGWPHQAYVWYLRDGDEVVVNSALGRRWPSNLLRDPRLSFAVAEGGGWVGLRGRVTVVDDRAVALADIAAMARRHAPDVADAMIERFRTEERISFRLAPDAIHVEL